MLLLQGRLSPTVLASQPSTVSTWALAECPVLPPAVWLVQVCSSNLGVENMATTAGGSPFCHSWMVKGGLLARGGGAAVP